MAQELGRLGFRIVTGSTDSHMFLVDLRPKGITGKDAEIALDKAGITVNKNAIPYDPEKPFIASGIRIGTPAVTTRGMRVKEMRQIAAWINDALVNKDDQMQLELISAAVKKLCNRFPLYKNLLKK
jgi:glycine hydroxymethyltransferase